MAAEDQASFRAEHGDRGGLQGKIFFAKRPVIPPQMLTFFSCVGQVRREPAGEIGEHHQGAGETQLEGEGAGRLGGDEEYTAIHL